MEKRQERKLAAIMYTDMVGYTALMQEDESRARAVRDRLRNTHRTYVARHGGQILQFYGDGILCSFAGAIEATRCAMELQKVLQKKPKIPARFGIHALSRIASRNSSLVILATLGFFVWYLAVLESNTSVF